MRLSCLARSRFSGGEESCIIAVAGMRPGRAAPEPPCQASHHTEAAIGRFSAPKVGDVARKFDQVGRETGFDDCR